MKIREILKEKLNQDKKLNRHKSRRGEYLSFTEILMFIIVITLFANGKVKQGIVALLGGSLVIALIEIYLKI
ncbi:hypothetical protein [Clostridium sp. BJN0013]|uniref:hypothetical protein n=1 Tax=Clostridium sp. BJN0013 TaxID=3236840 RepID=UPI0034C5D18E